jgi:hypothetical protein
VEFRTIQELRLSQHQELMMVLQAAEAADAVRMVVEDRLQLLRFAVILLDLANKQQARSVRLGLNDGARAQVLEGLKIGDRVLLAPASSPSAPDAAPASSPARAAPN